MVCLQAYVGGCLVSSTVTSSNDCGMYVCIVLVCPCVCVCCAGGWVRMCVLCWGVGVCGDYDFMCTLSYTPVLSYTPPSHIPLLSYTPPSLIPPCHIHRPLIYTPLSHTPLLSFPLSLREAVFNRVIEQDMGFFESEEVGVITSRLGADCQVIARLFSTNINVALRNAVQFVGRCVWFVWFMGVGGRWGGGGGVNRHVHLDFRVSIPYMYMYVCTMSHTYLGCSKMSSSTTTIIIPPTIPPTTPGGACYLCYLCPPLAATTITVTVLLWTVTSRYGAFSRRCMKAYQDR